MRKPSNYYIQREILKYLHDIQESIASIHDYIGDKKDFDDYKSNKQLKRAVKRELEIIGETTNRILKTDSTIEIPDSKRIVDLRNWIIHGYDTEDDVIIWGIIFRDIPNLKEQINKMLEQ